MAITVSFVVRAERAEDLTLASWRAAVDTVRELGEVTTANSLVTDQFGVKLVANNLWDAAMLYRDLLENLESLAGAPGMFGAIGLDVSDAGSPVAVEVDA